jgi:S1-C subfamily serine protease
VLASTTALCAGAGACSSPGSSSANGLALPHFNDITTASPKIQTAARAVVRVRTAGQVATAFFISPSGLLLTNNHVLGISVCPVQGCYVTLTQMHERGQTRQ